MPKLQKQLPCDVRRDVVPVVSLGQVDFVRVGHPRHGLRTVQDFTAAARAQPGRFDDPSAGRGSRRHPRHGGACLMARIGLRAE